MKAKAGGGRVKKFKISVGSYQNEYNQKCISMTVQIGNKVRT